MIHDDSETEENNFCRNKIITKLCEMQHSIKNVKNYPLSLSSELYQLCLSQILFELVYSWKSLSYRNEKARSYFHSFGYSNRTKHTDGGQTDRRLCRK